MRVKSVERPVSNVTPHAVTRLFCLTDGSVLPVISCHDAGCRGALGVKGASSVKSLQAATKRSRTESSN